MFKKKDKFNEKRNNRIVINAPGYQHITESFNRLKDNVLFMNADNKTKVIQMTSSTAREGKTTILTNLAVSLAQNGKKVIIVDADLRAPRVNRPFKVINDCGIYDYILEDKPATEIIKHTEFNVDLICRGNKVENPSAVIASDKFKKLIIQLRDLYDYVLVDCPPVLEISDYIHVSTVCDGTIFCVAHGITKKNQVKEAVNLLKQSHINILGSVYTMVDKNSKNGAYYNYNYSYNYSSNYYSNKEEDEKEESTDSKEN